MAPIYIRYVERVPSQSYRPQMVSADTQHQDQDLALQVQLRLQRY